MVFEMVFKSSASVFHAALYFPLRSLDAPLLCGSSQEASSYHVDVREPADHEEPVGVLCKPPVPDLAETEDTFEYKEGMFHPGANPGLGPVCGTFFIRERPSSHGLLMGKVTRTRSASADYTALAGIGRVSPDTCLASMEEVWEDLAVMHIGRCGDYRVDEFGAAVHSYMGLHAEVPLLALACLVHLGVTLLISVLRGTRGAYDGGVDDGAGGDLDAVLREVLPYEGEEPLAEVVGLEDVAELADGGLIGSGFAAKVDADKSAHGAGIVKGLFNRGVREVEPVLEKMDTEHAFNAYGPSARPFGAGIKRRYNLREFFPGDDAVHLGKKTLPAGELTVPFKTILGKCLLAHQGILLAA